MTDEDTANEPGDTAEEPDDTVKDPNQLETEIADARRALEDVEKLDTDTSQSGMFAEDDDGEGDEYTDDTIAPPG